MIAGSAARVRVELGDARSYDVVIGGDVVAAVRDLPARTVAVLYDRNVEALAKRTIGALGDRVVATRALEGGEAIKSLGKAASLYDWLAAAQLDRDALLVAIGGGTITDLGGYVAATFLRGIAWCAVPTTLLAAVDASVGGKTGVNIAAGKNLVGAFHHPALVAIDPAAFATLDPRDLAAGLGEALKTALVADPDLFAFLERELPRALAADPGVLATIVAHCVAAKARVVAGDERERDDTGGRAVLNFGHTFGHALEKTCGYGTLRHGEAVTLGMRGAIALSRERGLDAALADRIDRLIRAIPTPPVAPAPDAVIAATASDKKRKAGRVRFIVIRGLAAPAIVDDVDEGSLRAALATMA
jgi:3-dehydroquinate synthase